MFQLFIGSYRDLEAAFLNQIRAQQAHDPLASLLVVSPSGHLLDHLQRQRLATDGDSTSILNTHFLTFYALAERLLADSNYTEQVVTEPAVYQELLQRILSGPLPEPVDLEIRKALNREGNALPRGLTGALAATLKDLRDAGVRVDYALQAAREGFLGGEAPEAAPTLALYARVVGLFEKYRLRSSADLLRRAAKQAPGHPWVKRQKAIFLYGFYDLTGVQLDLVLSLASHPNAQMYFPYQDHPAFAYAKKLLEDPALTSKISAKPRAPSAESPLELGPRNSALGPAVEIWSCSGARDEVWLTAKEILRLTDNGIPFHDIAILSRNLSSYLPALREIFRSHQIPYVCSRQEPAGSHPLIKTIRGLLALDERDPNSRTVRIDLKRSPYLRSREVLLPKKDSLATWSSHVRSVTTRLRDVIQLPRDASPEEKALLDGVLASIEELSVLDALNEPVTYEHFLERWGEKIDHLERPGPARPHEGVQVLDVQQARGLPFRAVFVLGMNEKIFPRLIREDPFLSDAARSALAQATGSRLGRKLDGYEEEHLLFELTRQAAQDYLYLLTERSDEEGKALIPSVYLKELERQDPGLQAHRVPRGVAEKFEHRPTATWTPRELSFLINRARLDPKAVYAGLGWDVAAFYRQLSTHRALESFQPGLGAHDGKIQELSLLKGVLAKPFSPNGLEDLAQCPFQYYAGHVLRITPKEDLAPGGELTPQALGRLFHKTLELFYTACRDQGYPKENELSERLRQAIEGCFTAFAEPLAGVYPLAIKSAKMIILKELLSFLKSDLEEARDTQFRPAWFEQPLEGTLPIPIGDHRFLGKPDRLDLRQVGGQTEVRVVDYKSGKPKRWTGRIETQLIQGKFLQLPIYLGLAAAFAEKTLGHAVTPAEATLRPIRETDEDAVEKTLTPAFWQSASAPVFAENLRELMSLVEKGNFYIEPDTGTWGYCARCDFARICRKEHMPSRLRAERDAVRERVSEKLSRTAPKDDPTEKKSKTRPARVS